MKINQAMIESYVRNLLGQVVVSAAIVSSATHVGLFSFGTHEWALVANTLWASLVPVVLRFVNKKDPAFGWVAEQATSTVTKKIDSVATKTTKKSAK
jgi:hypothetical protein